MGILITRADFVGDYSLVKSNSDDIDLFIEKYEKQILSQLLGSALLVLFQADLTGKIPQTQIYKDLYDPFVKEINGCNYEFIGMKEMCLAYVFFYYNRKNRIKASMNGSVENVSENATQVHPTFLLGYYNRSVRAYKMVQYLCVSSPEVYPTFAGIAKDYTSIL